MKTKHTATFHNAESIIAYLQSVANKDHLTAAKQFGINNETAVGISVPALRALAKNIGKNHEVALQLWQTNMHEARILASMIDDPAAVTARQIDEWTAGFNSWDVCDQVCGNLFNKTPLAIDKAIQFSSATEEYIKRAGFVLMATYAVHNKGAADAVFTPFLHCIVREATDDRNFVKKAVNWALRQIGKRNMVLHAEAVQTALRIQKINSPAARWIAVDTLRELQQEKTIKRIVAKNITITSASERLCE